MNKTETGDVVMLAHWLTGHRQYGRIGCRENAQRAFVRLTERAGMRMTAEEAAARFPAAVSSHLTEEEVRERLAEALEGHLPGPYADRAVNVLAPLVIGLTDLKEQIGG